jgi:hypothetical protein
MLFKNLLIFIFIVTNLFAIEVKQNINKRNITVTGNNNPTNLDYGFYIPKFEKRDIILFDKINANKYKKKYLYVGYGVYDKEEKNCKYLDVKYNKDYFLHYFRDLHTIKNDTYAISKLPYTYERAKTLVNKFAGVIAVPRDAYENQLLLQQYYNKYDTWIGLEKKNCADTYRDELNVTHSFNSFENEKFCREDKLNVYSPKDSLLWDYTNGNKNKHYVIIHIYSPDYKRPIKVCAPWWRVERTYKQTIDKIDPRIKNSLTMFKYIYNPKQTVLCTKYEKSHTNNHNGNRRVECKTYYDISADPICVYDMYNPICKVNNCKGYIENNCKLVDRVSGFKDYTFKWVKDTESGIMKRIKNKDKIVNNIYDCPPEPPSADSCIESNKVLVYPAECPGSECDKLVNCIRDGKTEEECLQNYKCEKVYGSVDNMHIDDNGNVIGLYGKCSDGSFVEAKVGILKEITRKCLEYNMKEELNITHRYCEAEATSVTHTIKNDITSSDIYQEDKNCVRINNLQEARPDEVLNLLIKDVGEFKVDITYIPIDKNSTTPYTKDYSQLVEDYINDGVSETKRTQEIQNKIDTKNSIFSEEWFEKRIDAFKNPNIIGIVRATSYNSLQFCSNNKDKLNNNSCYETDNNNNLINANDTVIKNKTMTFNINYYSTPSAKTDKTRVTSTNYGHTYNWHQGVNYNTLNRDILSYMGISPSKITDNSKLTNWLQRAYNNYSDPGTMNTTTMTVKIKDSVHKTCKSGYTANSQGYCVTDAKVLPNYKYLYVSSKKDDSIKNNFDAVEINQNDNIKYFGNFNNLTDLGITKQTAHNYYFYGSNKEIYPNQFSVFKRKGDYIVLDVKDISLSHTCEEYSKDLDNSKYTTNDRCIIEYGNFIKKPLKEANITDPTSPIIDFGDALEIKTNGYNSIFAIQSYLDGKKFGYFSTYVRKPLILGHMMEKGTNKELSPIFQIPYTTDKVTYVAHIKQKTVTTKSNPPSDPENFYMKSVWASIYKSILENQKNSKHKVSTLVGAAAGAGLGAGLVAAGTMAILPTIPIALATGVVVNYAIQVLRSRMKLAEYHIDFQIYKSIPEYDKNKVYIPSLYEHKAIIPKRDMIDNRDYDYKTGMPLVKMIYNNESYTSGIVKDGDINKKIGDFTNFKNHILYLSGFPKSTINSLQDSWETGIKIGWEGCKWYQTCHNKTREQSKTITKTIEKKVTTGYSGAVNHLLIYVPYLGDYNLEAFDAHGNKLASRTIYGKDFISTAGKFDYQKVNFAMAKNFNISSDIKDGKTTNACRGSVECEWGGGVSGANYEIGTPLGYICSKSNDAYVKEHSATLITIKPTNSAQWFKIKLKRPMPYPNRVVVVTPSKLENRKYRCYEKGKCNIK